MALNSPWIDITHSSPSCDDNAAYDYLPAPLSKNEYVDSLRPSCEVWPANPPRRSVFVDDHLHDHPLVTLLLAESWEGSPPVYICTGWELLADEDKYIATKLRRNGVTVVFEEYQAMPHCFAMIFPQSAISRRCIEGWAGFISRVVAENNGETGEEVVKMESSFKRIKAKSLVEVDLTVEEVAPYTEEEIRRRIEERLKRVREEGVGAGHVDGRMVAKL